MQHSYKNHMIIAIMLLFACVGCATMSDEKRKESLKREYKKYSCPLLHQKYKQLKEEKAQQENVRNIVNGANIAIGTIGILSGNGNISYFGKNSDETLLDEKMEIIEQTALDKECSNLSFE